MLIIDQLTIGQPIVRLFSPLGLRLIVQPKRWGWGAQAGEEDPERLKVKFTHDRTWINQVRTDRSYLIRYWKRRVRVVKTRPIGSNPVGSSPVVGECNSLALLVRVRSWVNVTLILS